MAYPETTKTFSVRLPEGLIARIKREAAERRIKIEDYVQSVLQRAVPQNGKRK